MVVWEIKVHPYLRRELERIPMAEPCRADSHHFSPNSLSFVSLISLCHMQQLPHPPGSTSLQPLTSYAFDHA